MGPWYTYLVHNPSSLELLSVCRIRQSISRMAQHVENNLLEKLTAGDFDDLRNPNVPISLQDMCLKERKLVLESCLRRGRWGLLEMSILLTDDIIEFDGRCDRWSPDSIREQLSPAVDIKLPLGQHQDLFLSLLIARCPKLESLIMHRMNISPTALEKFCVAMPRMTTLSLPCVGDKNGYEGAIRAISANMHHLEKLDIYRYLADAKSIECLLPTKDNALGGCPDLVHLNLRSQHGSVELMKKIILTLPKLRFLCHLTLVNALGELTEEEMDVDTARHINSLYAILFYNTSIYCYAHQRYDILLKSPAFQRIKNNITSVDIYINSNIEAGEQKQSAFLVDVLMSLPTLKSIRLKYTSATYKHVLPLLESIGDRIEYLDLSNDSGHLRMQDVMRTCKNLVELTSYSGNSKHQEHEAWPCKLPVLHYLTSITLQHMDQYACSADMLVALLQSPNLIKITIQNLKVMTDDVMFRALSYSPGGAAISKVTDFTLTECPLITAAPLVHWLTKDNCSLQYISVARCMKVDYETLKAAAERYPIALLISCSSRA